MTDPSAASFGLGPQATCVDAYITYDLYAHYDVSDHLSLHASALNVFNEKAPLDWVTYGGALGAAPWNPSLHGQGAIGRFFTLGASYKF